MIEVKKGAFLKAEREMDMAPFTPLKAFKRCSDYAHYFGGVPKGQKQTFRDKLASHKVHQGSLLNYS